MARFSTVFGLTHKQADLDFIDINLATDTRLYLDPYAIQIRSDRWSSVCGDHIRSFFNELLGALRGGNTARSTHLLSNLHEPNETFLGQSRGSPNGKAVGEAKAEDLARALTRSRAFTTGLLADLSEAELFIHGIGPDTISDLTTNVLRDLLSEYTVEQCKLYNIPVQLVRTLGPVWDITQRDWRSKELNLPVHGGRPILLVPKFCVRHRMSIDSQEFYTHHMIEYLKQEYLQQPSSGLVRTLKDGTPKVYKNAVKERHPLIKDELAAFVIAHPEVLESYKNIKGAKGPLSNEDLEKFFDEQSFSEALITRLNAVPSGSATASEYHSLCMGICTFLFYPDLICPVKEHELHNGRKRVDIKYTNSATGNFFKVILESNQTRSLDVMVECKNYTKEIANPELDQLSSRFGYQRGFFGLLLCRSMDDRARLIQRCRDTVNDGRGYIIILEDSDLLQLLGFVRDNNRVGIEAYMHQRFSEIRS